MSEIVLESIMLGTQQPTALAQFYQKIFGKEADWAEGDWYGFLSGKVSITIGPHSEVSAAAKEPGRIMLNFATEDVKKEFERMREEGAVVVKAPYEMQGMWIATLSDPDGNFFQLMSPWKEPL